MCLHLLRVALGRQCQFLNSFGYYRSEFVALEDEKPQAWSVAAYVAAADHAFLDEQFAAVDWVVDAPRHATFDVDLDASKFDFASYDVAGEVDSSF